MRYVPYGPELEGVPNIIVDGRGNDATVLVLSHWPRNRTPPELKADSSTEIVLNYLRSPQREAYRDGAEAVSNNHYDVDGLISLWAMLNPEAVRQEAEADLLVAIGECGDFDRWSGEQATKVTCALYGLESLPSSPIRQGLAGIRDYLERTAFLYREALPLVPQLLDDIGRFEEYWRDEYRKVEAGRGLFARGEATVQEVPELDLAIFQLPHEVHDMALYEQTACSRVALVIEGHRYQARYRYESWVEIQSRRPPPRIDLRPFADLLQSFEGNPGDWAADDVQRTLPRLRLRGPEGSTSPSSITPGLFLRLLAQYLRDQASNQELLWSPHTADIEYISELASD
ncbi:MAG: hypothetical protein A2148_09210 [Chloroflexi bacterium RBG_16_68_14]|nr:MAG: hypothetical protein A2148_09210 [Chloroflexi bacterium RBG_16_68_14]